MLYYKILDIFFLTFHSILIVFNLFGWMYKPLRKWNLMSLSFTAFSWFVLGIFFGMGYCFLTDWHWDVLSKLSQYPPENSYVQYLFRRIFNIYMSSSFADILTASAFTMSFAISIILNLKSASKLAQTE